MRVAELCRRVDSFTPNQNSLKFATLLRSPLQDEFYEFHFTSMFLQINSFVKEAFGTTSLNALASPWSHQLAEQFYHYAKEVARPDPYGTQWEPLLRDGALRCNLLQGMILKILDVNIFTSLLFGASTGHMATLGIDDAATIGSEGEFSWLK